MCAKSWTWHTSYRGTSWLEEETKDVVEVGVNHQIIGMVILFALLAGNKTISGKSYLYPLIPFKPQELKKKLTRTRMKQN